MHRRRGHYLGTEVDGKWWKRYTGQGFFARGMGDYWWDDEAFHFLRYLTADPLSIPFERVSALEVGAWHCGGWAWRRPIVKFVWSHRAQALSSGFVLCSDWAEVQLCVGEIGQRVSGTGAAIDGC